jgi:hypothetical protein
MKDRFSILFALATDDVWDMFRNVAANRGRGQFREICLSSAVDDLFQRLYEITGVEFETKT